jgi:hypothetical protein
MLFGLKAGHFNRSVFDFEQVIGCAVKRLYFVLPE